MPEPLSVGIAGFGAIGQAVAAAFATEDGIPGLRLAAIGARDAAKVRATLPSGLSVPPEVVGVAASPPTSTYDASGGDCGAVRRVS